MEEKESTGKAKAIFQIEEKQVVKGFEQLE